jgi:hypothetical protein
MGLPEIANLSSQTGFDPTIECSGHERLCALLGGIDQQAAIGRKAGSFIGV